MPPVASDREVQRAREAVRAWRESIHPAVQQAPDGLLPPRTAPDTPNVTRQDIENSSVLNDRVKSMVIDRTPTRTDYTAKPDDWVVGGSYTPSLQGGETFMGDKGNGALRVFRGNQYPPENGWDKVAQHEAIHATQGPRPYWGGGASTDYYSISDSANSIMDDLARMNEQGYREGGMLVNHLQEYYPFEGGWPGEAQAYMASGELMPPGQIPPWFRQKHLSGVLSPEAMNAGAPPLPDNRVSSIAPRPGPQPLDMRSYLNAMDGMSQSMRDAWAKERWVDSAADWANYRADNPNWGPKTRDEYFLEQRNNDVRYKGLIFGYG